ncbi:DWNN-domain-containing protein [Meira miltonrushii]|uniref:DWNN-domain-containing protein n=1 Tax=Meira miltonrushii TaxID=1280837 RepID=A0A316V4P0_9BASI|nr:DWNN-domain-containing protein [Meira miltonrushii]PWN32529.1 DWNN-domain-containing protein [Meira miltonrushii]
MASASVYYKFKSQREPSRITFDGTGISVWDLKREIIMQNKMGKGLDFDLGVYSADTEDEFKDDNFIIPRSSQVIVRRLPPAKPGRGSAAKYVADIQGGGANSSVQERNQPAAGPSRGQAFRGQMSMRFDGKQDGQPQQPSAGPQEMDTISGVEGDEASKIAAMFQATTEQWDETQEKMANATYRDRPGAPARKPARPMQAGEMSRPQMQPNVQHDRPPPIGYICFRCGTKGHWIHDCPTNEDRDFDNKPRFKRTTGIPKSMLKTVEAPPDGTTREGVMVTPDGSYVIAQVDSASWARNQAHRQKRLTKSDIYGSVPSDSKLACMICNKLLRDAVKTPCCSNYFCQEDIATHLLEHDFNCPECGKRVKDLADLQRDDEVRKQVREYIDAEMEKSEKKMQEAEQAEKDELDKAKREKEEVEAESKPVEEETVKEEAGQEAKEEEGGEGDENGNGADGNQSEWNGQTVQQIMMMLCNPQLPPPMRMQLQMQLRFLHNQFTQANARANPTSSMPTGAPAGQGFGIIGAHNVNPFAGQHQMNTPNYMPSIGNMGNVGMRMRL